ncbi:MAG TPA: hypothetical protein VGI66_11330 [Streptosporangiaceae bacterium]
MLKAGFIVARVSFLALAASMLGVAMLAAPAVAGQTSTCSSYSKCFFAVAVSPTSPAAGASTSFTFTIKNEASPQQLGSVQISAPAGFVITSASGASGTASFTSSSALFLNLSLASGSQTMLTVSATVPCGSGSYKWGIAAKQSNNFNGSGNDFQLDPKSAGNLTGTFTGSCTVQPCPPSAPCSASASSATTSGTVTTSSAAPGDSIVTRMEGANSSFGYSCSTYTAVSDVFGFAVFKAGVPQSTLLTGTLRIDKSLVKSSGHPGASSWQICYASTTPFTALPGTSGTTMIGGVTYNTGLLPNCSSSQAAPCVQKRNKNNAGDVVVTFLALGDPFAHG